MLCAFCAALTAPLGTGAQESSGPALEFARQDPGKIVTAEACGECHLSEYEVWEETPHATGFDTLHRKERAQTIAGKMGLRLLKRDSPCLACHYTAKVDDGELLAVEGVSCEACHGAARDWIDVHNDYGKGKDHTTETPEHRRQRIEASLQAGMRRPSDDLYSLAASCYGCHTVPDEELVNVGGHTTGSASFELVAWHEEIRHSFLDSFLTGDGTENRPLTLPEKRTLYALGRCLDLEASLRAMAEATEQGVYARAKARRVRIALSDVQAVARRTAHPALEALPMTVREVSVVSGNRAALAAAADEIRAGTQRFLAEHDPEELADLDPLILGLEEPEPEPVAVAAEGEGGEGAAGPGSGGGAGAGSTEVGGGGAPAAPATETDTGARPAVGELKRSVHPPSEHATLGPGACSGCHESQNQWWPQDAHYGSVNPFFDREPENVKIARLYGLRPSQTTRGDQICMDCHGTAITGRREVFDGVSCESCHGPAADYREPHKEGDEALGENRPGYVKALELGMVELKDLSVRAGTCSGCHYVTTPRLLSAGHPSGKGFDYAAGMEKVKHWEGPLAPPGEIRSAFAAAVSARGPVPEVPLARLSGGEAGGGSQGASGGAGSAGGSEGPSEERRTDRAAPPVPRPIGPDPVPGREVEPVDLPPFPEIDDSTPIERVLLLLKERLDLLYDAVQRGEP